MRRKRRKDHSLAPTSVAALVIALFFCFFFCFCISSSSLLSRSPKTVVSGLEQELRSLVTDFPRRWWPWWLLQWWNLDSGANTLDDWIRQYGDDFGKEEEGEGEGGGARGKIEKLWDEVCAIFGWRERERLLKLVHEPLWFADDHKPEREREKGRGRSSSRPFAFVPKIIHQTWKVSNASELPALFASFHDKWRVFNPKWSIRIWSDEEMLSMVAKHYPKWLSIFTNRLGITTTPMVVKTDIFRYMLMETYGGVYVDMDMEPLRPLEDLLELLRWPECVLGQEPLEHAVLLEGKRHFICNAVLVSKPKHQLWAVLLDKIYEEMTVGWMQYHPNPNPVSLTGPGKLTQVVEEEYSRWGLLGNHSCSIVKPEVFYPAFDNSARLHGKCLTLFRKAWRRKKKLAKEQLQACKQVSERLDETYPYDYPLHAWAVHHWVHTWLSKHSRRLESHVLSTTRV